MNKLLLIPTIALLVVLSGCSTYGQNSQDGLLKMEQGDYAASISIMEKKYSPEGDDRLLQHMELGLLKYLDARYQESIQHLNQAELIADELYTESASEMLQVALTNPRSGPYRGTDFEKVFIHYYKAMAFLQQALSNPAEQTSHLESARVEVRKVDSLLNAITTARGDFQDLKDEQESNFSKVTNIFNFLSGGRESTNDLLYREDAYIRYISGVIYELNGEYDDARISYQKAAQAYEEGFAEQYSLGSEITEQAWLDTIRMMKTVGGFSSEVETLTKTKLSSVAQQHLKNFDGDAGQVIIIQHLGRIPVREEMNLQATINKYNQELKLQLITTGTQQHRQEQHAWFYAMYADRGLLDLIRNYQTGGILKLNESTYTKTWPLDMAWGVVDALNIHQVLADPGIRVTIPYYPAIKKEFSATKVIVNGTNETTLSSAQSLAAMAVQEQVVNASSDLHEALSRETFKNMVTHATTEKLGLGSFAGLASKLITGATSAAETRNWLTLPLEMRIQRIPLAPGEHTVRIVTNSANGSVYDDITRTVTIDKGEVEVLVRRSLPHGSRGGSHNIQENNADSNIASVR